ncbi:MAG TPA: CNNM domain-containing protein [Verrucomicrobiota bacterium]|nr:CNNM domain-containing protein [Verrucomicrobiota bacterium]
MNGENMLTWIILPTCLTLSFLLSGMEAGVFVLSRYRVRRLMRSGRSSARVLNNFLENPERFLWTILVGNTIVTFTTLGWLVAVLHQHLADRRLLFAITFAALVFLFYALFDLLPKMLFRSYPNRLCMFFAKPFRLVYLALRPVVHLVEKSSAALLRWTGGTAFTGKLFGNREELRHAMQDSAQPLSTEERTMINRVLDLQSLTLRQITTPLQQVVMVETSTAVRDAFVVARERHLARLPAFETREGRRRIIGLIALHSLLYQSDLDTSKPVANFIRPAIFLPEDTRLEVALRQMQRGGQRLAVVLNPAGQETGVVSLEDILKVIFGEVRL